MRIALVDLENPQNTYEEIFEKLFKFIGSYDFLVCFLYKSNVLRKQEIESLMKKKYQHCDLLDMRVITCDVCPEKLVAMVFSSVKANRSVFQAAKTVEDIESLLRLQIVNKNYKYIEIGRSC